MFVQIESYIYLFIFKKYLKYASSLTATIHRMLAAKCMMLIHIMSRFVNVPAFKRLITLETSKPLCRRFDFCLPWPSQKTITLLKTHTNTQRYNSDLALTKLHNDCPSLCNDLLVIMTVTRHAIVVSNRHTIFSNCYSL